jgi:hypothetical protein
MLTLAITALAIAPQVIGADAPEPLDAAPQDRLIAAGAAAIGAGTGAAVGASGALLAGALLSGFNREAVGVPYAVLPPALTAAGAGLAADVAGGPRAAWAAGLAGLTAAGAVSVGVDVWLLDGQKHSEAETVAFAVLGPTLAGAVAAGAFAAVFCEDPATLDATPRVSMLR